MSKYYLVGVLFIASLLRLINLSGHPTGFTPDEASFAYDAYSISKTGADQWGKTFPLVLQSFGDGKMPLLSYLSVPSVAVFGLNEFAVRLPVALLGIGAVYFTYLLARRSFGSEKIALMAAFILAISPWHIAMTRGAFEASLTTFFLTAGIYFYLGLEYSKKAAFFSGLLFGLNLFTYHSARFITPLVLGFLILYKFNPKNCQNHLKNKNLLILLFVFTALLLMAISSMFMGAGDRLATSTILDTKPPADARFNALLAGLPPVLARLFNNRFFVLGNTFLDQYFQYFSPQFLFSQGPAEGTYGMLPGMGVLYLIELAFMFGLFLNLKVVKKVPWIIVWLLLAPIPAALSRGPGYAANRAIIMLPALSILLAIGWNNIYEIVSKQKKALYAKIILVIYVLSFVFFVEKYFIQQKYSTADAMLYGARDLFTYLGEIDAPYEQIIISKSLSEAHIYYAFYSRMDPVIYQNVTKNWNYHEAGVDWVDQMPQYKLGKYVFTSMDYAKYSTFTNTLMAGKPEEFPSDAQVIYTVKYPDLTDAYWVVNSDTLPFAYKSLN